LLIGEHGRLPYNEKGQKLYPRYELFQQIVAIFRKTGRSVPVFNDKHLYYDRRRAFEMVATARELNFPLYAGSSLPVTWRRRNWNCRSAAASAKRCGRPRRIGNLRDPRPGSAAMHGRTRTRGQQGVRNVQCLENDEVWKAGDAGVWSWELLEHALGRTPSRNVATSKVNCRHYAPVANRPTFPRGPVAFVIEYRDGLKATVLLLNGHLDDAVFAARIDGEKQPVSTLFYLPPPPGAAFLEALAWHIEQFLNTGRRRTPSSARS